jgi:hypothetical protein
VRRRVHDPEAGSNQDSTPTAENLENIPLPATTVIAPTRLHERRMRTRSQRSIDPRRPPTSLPAPAGRSKYIPMFTCISRDIFHAKVEIVNNRDDSDRDVFEKMKKSYLKSLSKGSQWARWSAKVWITELYRVRRVKVSPATTIGIKLIVLLFRSEFIRKELLFAIGLRTVTKRLGFPHQSGEITFSTLSIAITMEMYTTDPCCRWRTIL